MNAKFRPFNFYNSILTLKTTHSTLCLAAGLLAFTVWGSLVLYWKALGHVNAFEILLHRMFWSLVTIALLALITGSYPAIKETLKQKSLVLRVFFASSIIAGNWLLYIWSVNNEKIVEASLGYFINPLLSVLIGRLLLGEKMTRLQILAIAIASIGVTYSVVAYGAFPLIGLTLACSFATYGYIKKSIKVSVIPGFFLETCLLFPVAAGCLIWLQATGQSNFFAYDASTQLLLMGTGIITAFPLLLFAYASKGVQLSSMGLMQYLAPTINLIIGVYMFGEEVSTANQVMLICIWAALALYTWCSIRHYKQAQHNAQIKNA